MRKTKIVATLGPATEGPEKLEELIRAGVDVCRLNFSFGSYEDHRKRMRDVRTAAERTGKAVAILQDLQGPKIRVGKLTMDVELTREDTVVLTGRTSHESPLVIPTTYPGIAHDTEPGKQVFLADGTIRLEITEVRKDRGEVVCKVVNGGRISTGKGINLPYTNISMPSLTEKDRDDALFGAEAGVDYIALSFVRKPEDVHDLKRLLGEAGREIPVIAKIEKPEALDNLAAILDASDGVMIARGDLATEIPLSHVPIEQKRIIRTAHRKGKLTIVATQMLESMTDSPRPTRAEASDVANAIYDGTDAVMLSGETSIGKYPVPAVGIMAEIAEDVEKSLLNVRTNPELTPPYDLSIRHSLCASASFLSYIVNEKALAVYTRTGITVQILSKYRPQSNILGVTYDRRTFNRMALYHNVIPVLVPEKELSNRFLRETEEALKNLALVEPGDKIIVLSGEQGREGWQTNSITVETVRAY